MLHDLLREIRACELCSNELPLGPRPVIQADRTARLLIIGQAPGRKVHESGIPWNDVSGERLRSWLNITPELFYDPSRIAIMPMGFCYPGVSKSGSGDAPPMGRCAPTWHHRLLASLPDIRLTLLVGSHAQRGYLPRDRRSMTETVKAFDRASAVWALPHPSWRVVTWMSKNPWFQSDLLPTLRTIVADTLAD
ncbi:MAG: hypothetical protein CML24_04420 [Rhizobiales bacterium]|nr:hypothetical protein [Hyphomicrobiales bacterium]|tara:strand:- start:3513 stop:4091 length:579 start_codon:yes stop_codon:yes gene_type:complete